VTEFLAMNIEGFIPSPLGGEGRLKITPEAGVRGESILNATERDFGVSRFSGIKVKLKLYTPELLFL